MADFFNAAVFPEKYFQPEKIKFEGPKGLLNPKQEGSKKIRIWAGCFQSKHEKHFNQRRLNLKPPLEAFVFVPQTFLVIVVILVHEAIVFPTVWIK